MTLSSSLSVSETPRSSRAGCVNDACVGNYAPVYVLVEGLGTPLPRVDVKGTWTAVDLYLLGNGAGLVSQAAGHNLSL